jgi:TPR repeat protein
MNRTSRPMSMKAAMNYIFILLFAFSGSGFALAAPSETQDEANSRHEKEYADKKQHAEQGDPQAQYEWGIDCIYRQKGTPVEGLHWLLLAAAQGNIDAEAQAGICYATKTGTEENVDEAVRMLRHASSKGNMYALQQLGLLSINGYGTVPKDLKQAEKYLSDAVEKGNAGAKNVLKTVRDLLKKEDAAHADGKPTP